MKFVIISSFVVPHNTLAGEIHWLWYRITHFQLKYTGCGCISPGNVSYGTTISVFHLAMCYAVPLPVPFTWQCFNAVPRPVQPSNMSYGTTTSVLHLTMCHTVPQPVYFSWKCVMRYHNQCISPANVLCGTTNEEIITNTGCGTVRHIARLYWSWYRIKTLPGERHWSWYRIAHCQVKYTDCGTVWHIARWNTLVVIPYDILLGCTGRGTA
jgi:hypothetical protein